MGTVRVGTSGWVYPPWRSVFYPPGLVQRKELAYLADQLTSVEINGSFYALQRPASYQHWASQTASDFVFAVKAPRFVTHLKRLRDVETPVANFLASGVLALGPRLGPLLWQLPPTFQFQEESLRTLRAFLGLLPHTTAGAAELALGHDERIDERAWTTTDEDRPLRHAIEVRHASFASDEFVELAKQAGVAIVVADTAGKFPYLEHLTTDFVYVRLHGDVELYTSGYTEDALQRWAAKVRGWAASGRDVYVYFDNDVKVRAPFDAKRLIELV
ncbi:DUF72 domain-containing protein [Aldersonia sp. NBC_00410]|uniref:DUF72 domain-containing protein n=1 Tax=Aldersonia sp. NBC_00410 TaxID=2975954 RepID=UPI002255BC6B|nr:DUF72 domain-containing protein [Aldersonia sp. NBC_00410]MCX5042220.1 DUF72 domain-containing protein [Aldersonia sp. NBC_00410]